MHMEIAVAIKMAFFNLLILFRIFLSFEHCCVKFRMAGGAENSEEQQLNLLTISYLESILSPVGWQCKAPAVEAAG